MQKTPGMPKNCSPETKPKLKIGAFRFTDPGYGGSRYEEMLAEELKHRHNVTVFNVTPKFPVLANRPQSILRVWAQQRDKDIDLWIRNEISTMGMSQRKHNNVNIMLMHHFDDQSGPFRILNRLLANRMLSNACKCDAVVVVSQFWKDFLSRKGVRNIEIIYNGFDVEKYRVESSRIQEFKRKHHLTGKAVLYLGGCQKEKGVGSTVKAIGRSDYHLVTSGIKNTELPCTHLDLSFTDYRTLLAASSASILMSKMTEGWNRTAHESMLAGTPVIGTGSGGMAELLLGGKQVINTDFSLLPRQVSYVLENRDEFSRSGHQFASLFTRQRFAASWLGLIDRVAD